MVLLRSIINKRRNVEVYFMPFNPTALDDYLEYLYVTGQLDPPTEEDEEGE